VHPVVRTLLDLSRTPRPDTWVQPLVTLAAEAVIAETRHATDRAELTGLADAICLTDAKPLVQKIVPASMPDVGKLLAAGRELRSALDSEFADLRAAVRDAASATKVEVFSAAIERGQKFLKLAQSTNGTVERLAGFIDGLLEKLGKTDFVSSELVVPKRTSYLDNLLPPTQAA
jgi:hypothetical protein